MDENGLIEIRGRLDHQVKIRGFRVELGEIDTAALQFPNIAESVTVTVPSPDGENRLVTYISSPEKIESKKLRDFVGESLPSYMIPAMVIQLDKLPRNFSGKIDRAALPPVEISTVVEADNLSKTDAEKKLAELIAKVLKIPASSIGVNTDLFEFGLDSLLVFDLILEIQKQFRIELIPEQIIQNSTISALTTLIPDNVENIEIKTNIKQSTTGQPNDATRYPLSEEHRKYYTYWTFTGGTVMMPSMLKFNDKIDSQKLADSFRSVINAHPFFKANIQVIDNEPYWKRQNDLEVTPTNIRNVSQEEFTNIIDNLITRKEFNPDLAKDPLYFAEIYCVDDVVYLLMAFHHIYYDGMTKNIITDDLISAYNGIELQPDTEHGFIEGAYENEYRKSEEFQAARQVYEKLFQNYRSPLRLTSECGEPNHISKEVSVLLEADALQQFCKRNKIFLNVMFLAGICVTASRLSGEEYLFLITETGGRNGRSLAREAGLFVRNFPLALRVDKNLSGLSLINSIGEQYSQLLNRHSGFTSGLAKQYFGFNPNFNYLFQAGVTSVKPTLKEPSYVELSREIISKVFKSGNIYFDCDVQIFKRQMQDKDYFYISVRYDVGVYSETIMQNFIDSIRDYIEGICKGSH
jgi:acyl carrier protein